MCMTMSDRRWFRIDIRHHSTHDLVYLEGELDLSTVPLLEAEIARFHWSPSATVVVDLLALDFMDCAGLGALIHFSNEAATRGGRVSVRRPNPLVAKVIKLVGPPAWC